MTTKRSPAEALVAHGLPAGRVELRAVADAAREEFRQDLLGAIRRYRRSRQGSEPLPVVPAAFRRACRSYARGRPTLPSQDMVELVVQSMGGDVEFWLHRLSRVEDLDFAAPPASLPSGRAHVGWPSPDLLSHPPLG